MPGGAAGTILVVDDEPAIRLLCRVNLELEGYRVLEAGTLADARARLDDLPVDVVLLDLHLGSEVSHALIQELSDAEPPVPVALISGSADLASAQAAGATRILPKPFRIDELTGAVADLLALRRAAR